MRKLDGYDITVLDEEPGRRQLQGDALEIMRLLFDHSDKIVPLNHQGFNHYVDQGGGIIIEVCDIKKHDEFFQQVPRLGWK